MGLAPNVLTLLGVAERVDDLAVGSTIFAAGPWTPQSKAIVVLTPGRGGIQRTMPADFAYFMDVDELLDIQEWWPYKLGREPSAMELCEQMIRVASEGNE